MIKPNPAPVLLLVGPTGTGKTATAIELCKLLDGEIVSADSIQIYRGCDIVTAKATPAERAAARHHLIDVCDPREAYSAARWADDARLAIEDIASRGKLPIVAGLVLASTIIIANYVPTGHNGLVIAVMSVAFFGQGLTNLGWTVLSDIAPKQVIGLTAGIFNFSANVAGIVTPIVIGVALGVSGSFVGPLIYIAVVALIGAFAYIVILGDIHRLELDAEPTTTVASATR